MRRIALCALASLAMTGCASMGFASADLSAQKLKLVQPVLDKTPDGAVGYWKLDDQNFGLVAVDSTMRKAQTTCRLVRENEVRGGNATHLVASYCREGKGAWQ